MTTPEVITTLEYIQLLNLVQMVKDCEVVDQDQDILLNQAKLKN